MNSLDDQLEWLFRAAGGVNPNAGPIPYGLETRVMAAWRAQDRATPWNTGLLVRGLVLASVIMGLSLLSTAAKTTKVDSDYLQLADSTLQVDSNL